MEILVKTTSHRFRISVPEDIDVGVLKERIFSEGKGALPQAQQQRIVHRGKVLHDGTLMSNGINSGDVLCVLRSGATMPSLAPQPSTRSPSREAIDRAIAEELKRGLTGSAQRPSRSLQIESRRAAPEDAMDNRLMQLVEALEGRLSLLGVAGGGQGSNGAADFAFPIPVRMSSGASAGLHGQGRSSASAGTAPAPATVPDPNPGFMTALMDMGFPEVSVRKALLLHRNEMDPALDWLLQHGESPEASVPLTQEQLEQIYTRQAPGPPSEASQVQSLVDMGFDRAQALAALRRFRSMDLALAYLLRAAPATPSPPAASASAAAAGHGSESAGSPAGRGDSAAAAAPSSAPAATSAAGGPAGQASVSASEAGQALGAPHTPPSTGDSPEDDQSYEDDDDDEGDVEEEDGEEETEVDGEEEVDEEYEAGSQAMLQTSTVQDAGLEPQGQQRLVFGSGGPPQGRNTFAFPLLGSDAGDMFSAHPSSLPFAAHATGPDGFDVVLHNSDRMPLMPVLPVSAPSGPSTMEVMPDTEDIMRVADLLQSLLGVTLGDMHEDSHAGRMH